MRVEVKSSQATASVLIVRAVASDMASTRDQIALELATKLKLPGFRAGKVPPELAVKEVDQNRLVEAFLQSFVPRLAQQALELKQVRPVVSPEVSVTKFVPFEQLELTIEAQHLGEVKLADWRKLSLSLPEIKATAAETKKVLERLRLDFATFKPVARPAAVGDRVRLDFQGSDEQGQALGGASGRDYPLILGEQSFIAGFEEKIIGHKVGGDLEFKLCFPKDHSPRHLAGQPVVFKVQLRSVESIKRPELNDALAAQVGSFKSLAALKKVIRAQIIADKRYRARELLLGQTVARIAQESKIEIPAGLAAEETKRLQAEHQTWLGENQLALSDWLKEAKLSVSQHEDKLKQTALNRIKGGLVLRQIAVEEQLVVDDVEVERRLGQYADDKTDESRRAALRQDIRAQLLVRKALDRLGEIVISEQKPPTVAGSAG